MKKRWKHISTNKYGGILYIKGDKNLLIFIHRAFMWYTGKDSIIRER